MRYVYCASCGRVSRNFRFERDRCFYCGARGEIVEAKNAWQIYASSALLIGAAAVFVFVPIASDALKWLLLIAVLAVAFTLSSWGLSLTKSRILASKTGRMAKEEKA